MSTELDSCSSRLEGSGVDDLLGLRIGAIFVILVGGTAGALFPVLASRSRLGVPRGIFEFAKYFGSGVIIATAFIHLLAPALEALGSECLSEVWQQYPYALAIWLVGIFVIFIVELVAFRWGTTKLASLGLSHDAHGHGAGALAAHGPEGVNLTSYRHVHASDKDSESGESSTNGNSDKYAHSQDFAAQLVGIAILEFGVMLHSVLIGLTLAVDESFKVLFVVITFHQTFEGLGVGSRLAAVRLSEKHKHIPVLAAILYGITTPVGMAAGLGLRTYNPEGTTASMVSGILDAFSAGILIYTGLVELLAHEFLFNKEMINASNSKLAYALGSMLLGVALMALLGRWA